LSEHLNTLEAAEPGERDGRFASPFPQGRARHEHADVRMVTIVNILDEVDLGADLILETGMTIEKYLQA
jgi:acetoacetate decarboxylase